MALQRLTPFQGESPVDMHETEISNIMDELNRGVDPSTIAPKGITADKLRILHGGLTKIAFGSVAAGTMSKACVISITSNGAYYEGNYLQTVTHDWFVDPADTTNLYNNTGYPTSSFDASVGLGGGSSLALEADRIIPICFIRNSINTATANQVSQVVMQVYNAGASSHIIYATFNIVLLATQLTGGS